MKKKYTVSLARRAALPRSERLRNAGGSSGGVGGSSVLVTTVSGGNATSGPITVVDPNSHTHANKSDLDRISTDADGYAYLSSQEPVTDDAGVTTIQTKAEKVKAGYADMAADLTPDSPVRKAFLSRLVDDIAKGHITFEQGLKSLALAVFDSGAQFGQFVAGMLAGTGAAVDGRGNAEFESVRVRSYFEALEFIVNRLAAIEGDQLLTEGDTIESVDADADGTYTLHFRSKWDGYFTAQAPGNVLKGIINTLGQGSGVYYTAWMRVNSVNAAANTANVSVYPGDECPAGVNFPPCAMMKVARWGNQTDPQRQSCLYLSSTEGRIVKLTGVTKPIIDIGNYGATFGTLPEFFQTLGLPIDPTKDYMYARGIVVQDIVRMDHMGTPVAEVVDRGPWAAGESYYASDLNPATGRYEISDVWYMGCRYRCARTGTTAAPAWNCTDWAMVEGNPDFSVDFAESEQLFDVDNFNTTLTVVARLHNQDVTAGILPGDVEWTRSSADGAGNVRTDSDIAWALRRAGAGLQLALDRADCDFNSGGLTHLAFTATVTLRDGAGAAVASDSVTFGF